MNNTNIFKQFNGENTNVLEVLKEIEGDFLVEKRNILSISDMMLENLKNGGSLSYDDVEKMLIPTHRATTKEDGTPLGVVSPKYEVVQNYEGFSFIDTFTNNSGAKIETAGTLNGGRRVFLTAKMPTDLIVEGDNSPIENYIVFHNSHDGSTSVTAVVTPIRVVCRNTLAAALSSANKISFKHTKNIANNLYNETRAAMLLGLNASAMERFKQDFAKMRAEVVLQRDVLKFATDIFVDSEKTRKELAVCGYNWSLVDSLPAQTYKSIHNFLSCLENGVGQDALKGTKMWLYNGLTTYFQNHLTYKSEEVKFLSTFEGQTAKKVKKAYDLLTA